MNDIKRDVRITAFGKFSVNSKSVLQNSYANFPVLGYIASFLVFLGIPGLAEILHTKPSSDFLDLGYDIVVLAAVNAPFILWAVLFATLIPRFFLILLALVFLFFASVIFYIIITQVGFTVLASFSVIGLVFLSMSALFSYTSNNM